MKYTPRSPAQIRSLEELTLFLGEELRAISTALEVFETEYILLQVQHVAPNKVFDGMVMAADGTNWNPGSGRGIYEYRTGTGWVLIG